MTVTLSFAPPHPSKAIHRPYLCKRCRYNTWPCKECKDRLGVTPEWAAKFLGFTSWHEVNPTNKKDREYILNAAIKTWHSRGEVPYSGQYWLLLAKNMLMING